MMHKKKVKGKWQYYEDGKRISEYDYILKTEGSEELVEVEEVEE